MKDGFFTRKEVESKSRPGGKSYSCAACGLYKDCNSPRMQPYGNFKKRILNVGEAPVEMEDESGKPWQGKAGRLIQRMYKSLGIDLFEDCLNINSVNCRPVDENGDNRTPSNAEVECCRKSVLKAIEIYKPKVIVCLGNSALFSLIGHRWKKDLGGITKWRGWTIPDQDYNAWVCPTFHPSFIMRSLEAKDSVEEVIWKQDLKQAFELIKTPFLKYVEPEIEIIKDLSVLNKIKAGEVAFDYETTGIKPHGPGHRIVSASIADTPDHVYSFLMPLNRKEQMPFINILTNPKIEKIAQNMKFEHTWSIVRLKTEVVNWVWDTMIATHIFDNRIGVTGLKFQTYVQFGIVDYASEVAPFLEAKDNRSANAINRIDQLLEKPNGRFKLLRYGGYDSIYELRLANKQRADLLPF